MPEAGKVWGYVQRSTDSRSRPVMMASAPLSAVWRVSRWPRVSAPISAASGFSTISARVPSKSRNRAVWAGFRPEMISKPDCMLYDPAIVAFWPAQAGRWIWQYASRFSGCDRADKARSLNLGDVWNLDDRGGIYTKLQSTQSEGRP